MIGRHLCNDLTSLIGALKTMEWKFVQNNFFGSVFYHGFSVTTLYSVNDRVTSE
jgi:hypothetical protein